MCSDAGLVAIVDDDDAVSRALTLGTRSLGYDARTFASGEALLGAPFEVPPVLLLLDLHLPGVRGPDLIAQLRARGFTPRIVVMTGRDSEGAKGSCLAAGADAYIRKPLSRADLSGFLPKV